MRVVLIPLYSSDANLKKLPFASCSLNKPHTLIPSQYPETHCNILKTLTAENALYWLEEPRKVRQGEALSEPPGFHSRVCLQSSQIFLLCVRKIKPLDEGTFAKKKTVRLAAAAHSAQHSTLC